MLNRLRWFMWPAFLAVVAIGFDFRTPASHFADVEGTVQEIRVVNLRQDSAIAELGVGVRALVIAQCLDRPRRETQLMGLRCDRLLGPNAPPHAP